MSVKKRKTFFQVSIILASLFLSGCIPPPPDNTNQICSIFAQYPYWYQATQAAEQRWGTPIYVQLAILQQESGFRAAVRPPRPRLWGFIPLPRPSSAYGYPQAQDDIWSEYKAASFNWAGARSDFIDAVDFIAWYGKLAHDQLGISQLDTYNLYLAYHEGLGGFRRKTFANKKWLEIVAKNVATRAKQFSVQLTECTKK